MKMGRNMSVILIILIAIIFTKNVNAQNYTTNNNLFEDNISKNLMNYAIIQEKDILNNNYIIFRNDNNYYLVTNVKKEEVTKNNNNIKMNNTTIYHYNNTYNNQIYEIIKENETNIIINNIVQTNIKGLKNGVQNTQYRNEYIQEKAMYLLVIIVGLIFMSILTKERNYI